MPEIRHCPNGHNSDENGQCTEVTCAFCDPIVKKPTKRKEGLPLQRRDRKGNK